MNRCEWIICERGNRWASALRIRIVRDFPSHSQPPRLREARSLAELTQHLETRSHSVAMVETHEANLANVLAWLAAATRQYPDGRFVALLDTPLVSRKPGRQDVVDALFEAGAVEVGVSPRRVEHILALAKRHAADVAVRARPAADDLSLIEWAWSRLPWQDT
jgi:hypothetical protein